MNPPRRPWREWWRPAVAFSIAIGLGALLAAPQLLASLELTDAGTRSLEAIGLQAMFPHPWPKQPVAASLVLLLAIGNKAVPFPFAITGLLLLPIAFASPQRRIVIGLFALLLLVFGMAIGPATPLFDVYRMLPGVGSFRLPTLRLLVVVGFLLAMLAAYGLDELLRRVRAGAGARTAAGVGALVVALAAIEPLIADTKRPALPYTGLGAEAVFEGEVRLDVLQVLGNEHERMLFWNPGYSPPLPSKLGAVLGVRIFDDYEPMSLRRQSDYFDYLAYGSIKQHQRSPFFGRLVFPRSPGSARKMASRRRLLDLAAVKLLVGTNSQRHNTLIHIFAKAAGLVRKPDDKRAWKTAPLVYLNQHALPRAYVTYRALPAPPADELLPRLASPSFEPRNVSYVEGPEIGRDATRRRGHAATIARDEPSEIEIHVNLAQEGLVVLADSYYPGWTATIDGEPAEILATNHLFRGVVVPGGVHTIVYRYEPWWLPVGGVAFAGGLAGVALLAWRGLGRRSDG